MQPEKKNILKKMLFPLGIILGCVSCFLGERIFFTMKQKKELASWESQALYLLGQQEARRVDLIQMNPKEAEIFAWGFQDWAGLSKSYLDYEALKPRLEQFLEKRRENHLETLKKAEGAYIARFVREGGSQLKTGLAYRMIRPGSAKKPGLRDWVDVRYHAKLRDGRVVDATPASGESAKFPLSGVIEGWSQGLQLVGEGGAIELVIPSHLAYGDQGTYAGVPPGEVLIFHIELLKIIDFDIRKD